MERILLEKQLYRDRGLWECVKAAYWLVANNFGRILKGVLAPALTVMFFFILCELADKYEFYGYSRNPIINFIIQNASVLQWIGNICFWIAIIPFMAKFLCLLNGKDYRWNCIRFAKIHVLNIAVIFALKLIMELKIDWDGGESIAFWIILLAVLTLLSPLITYVYTKYLFDESFKISQFREAYSVGYEFLHKTVGIVVLPFLCFGFLISRLISTLYGIWDFGKESELIADIVSGMLGAFILVIYIIWHFSAITITYGSIENIRNHFYEPDPDESDELNGDDVHFFGI